MGEVRTAHREQRGRGDAAPPGYERRHGWKEQETGLGKPSLALEGPIHHLGTTGGEPSHKETKEREAGRVADGVVVPEKPRKARWREGPLLKNYF